MTESSQPASRANRAFATTSWSIVLRAADSDAPETRQALAELCEVYWYPLYAFVRQKGHQRAEAEDLTQAFFAELLEKKRLKSADRQRGRFRTFLLVSLNNFVINRWKQSQAIKRGGGNTPLSLDFERADRRFQNEPFHESTPEKMFERTWALTLLNQTIVRLQAQYQQSGKEALFNRLKIYLGKTRKFPMPKSRKNYR